MLHQTRGIAIHATKYSETSSVVRIYTELFGLQSYLVKGIRKQHAKIKAGLFQPLTLLDLVVYHKEKSSLQSLKEAHFARSYQSIPFDIRKSSLALFINELVYKTIREEEPHPELFGFLYETCISLDNTEENLSCFHLAFALRLTRYLGCCPRPGYSEKNRFLNLREGIFQGEPPDHSEFLDAGLSFHFNQFLLPEEEGPDRIKLPASTRNSLLEAILKYYRLHVPGFREMQSHHVLHTVLA